MTTPRQQHRQGALARKLMFTLLAFIAIIVVAVLYSYGFSDPTEGPGNLPPEGAGAPHPERGMAPARESSTP